LDLSVLQEKSQIHSETFESSPRTWLNPRRACVEFFDVAGHFDIKHFGTFGA
jgi:hypothetical protein